MPWRRAAAPEASDAQTLDAGCPALRRALARLGFFRAEPLPVLGYLKGDIGEACTMYRPQSWFLSAGDCDFEFTYFKQGWRDSRGGHPPTFDGRPPRRPSMPERNRCAARASGPAFPSSCLCWPLLPLLLAACSFDATQRLQSAPKPALEVTLEYRIAARRPDPDEFPAPGGRRRYRRLSPAARRRDAGSPCRTAMTCPA